MSTPAENIDTNAAATVGAVAEGGLPSLSETDSWITDSAYIDGPAEEPKAPLPAATDVDAAKAAAPVVEAKPGAAVVDATAKPVVADAGVKEEPKTDAVTAAGVKPVVAAEADLSAQENDLVQSRPEAERPDLSNRLKRAHFMDHFLNPDKPKEEVRLHLAERSPSNYAELETAVLNNRLATPETFLADLFQRAPETYTKMVEAAFKGDPAYWTKQITGRDEQTPETVKTALDFYDKNKDRIAEVSPLSVEQEAKIKEMEEYFPEEAASYRKTLEDNQRLATEAAQRDQQKANAEKPDPNKAKTDEATQQAAYQKQVTDIWDAGVDVVDNFVATKAYDPKTGIGIHVTAEERTAAPLVAMLKDMKANVFFHGIEADGKPLIENFQKGLTDWGSGRNEFKDILTHMDKYTQALEKQNVLDLGQKVLPYADTYYAERLKHPLFALIDQAIQAVSDKAAIPPKTDTLVPGRLPSQDQKPTVAGAHDDSWLVADAVKRA